MPILKNARHEAFALALAEGKSQEQAYIDAGFSAKGARANATTLLKREKSVLQRRDEILSQREELRTKAVVEAAHAAGVTLEGHLAKLAELRDQAAQEGKYSAAVGAEVARGKVAGFYIERHENGKPGDFADLSDEELRARIAARSAIAKAAERPKASVK
jgi:phage terminase small subunit